MTPFYYSWTAQEKAVAFETSRAVDDHFVLANGKEVFDFVSTSFQANFGHSFAPIKQRITQQLDLMPIASPKATFDLKLQASHELLKLLGLGDGKLFYTVSGAEAVENALKIARQMTGRKLVAARQKSYHGASLGALSVTGDWRNDPHLTFAEGTLRIPEHDDDPDLVHTAEIIDTAGSENVAAVILETISGTNGMAVPTRNWIQGIEQLCRQRGIMLIIDEVLVGFGRCGEMFAFQKYELKPDMVCLSKAITGGYIPFGAVWTQPDIASHYHSETLACGLTNYGHPLGLAAMQAVIETLNDPSFLSQKKLREDMLRSTLQSWAQRTDVREIRCAGTMAAIYMARPTCSWQTAFDHGMHLYAKDNMILLAPPYNCSIPRLQNALATLGEII